MIGASMKSVDVKIVILITSIKRINNILRRLWIVVCSSTGEIVLINSEAVFYEFLKSTDVLILGYTLRAEGSK